MNLLSKTWAENKKRCAFGILSDAQAMLAHPLEQIRHGI
jgi:hypothetical protein